jgi:hypothetical protein
MKKRELERLSDLLAVFYEDVAESDGGLADDISRVRHEVQERLDEDSRDADGPYSAIADGYMRRTTP